MPGGTGTAAVLWVVAAIGLAGLEVLSLDLVWAMLAAGALAAAGTAAVGAPFEAQTVAAVAVALLGVAAVRPIWLRNLRNTPVTTTGSDALVGRNAKALRDVTEDGGLVKIGGEEWSARLSPGAPVVPAGSVGRVVRIDGATAIIAP